MDCDVLNWLAITIVGFVVEAEAGHEGVNVAVTPILLPAAHVLRLIDSSKGIRDVIEFRIDGITHGGEAHHHSQDGDGHHQHHLGRDDEALFVVRQL